MFSAVFVLLAASTIVIYVGSRDSTNSNDVMLISTNTVQWEELENKRIIIGYRSLGRNLIDGINDLGMERAHNKLKILSLSDFEKKNVNYKNILFYYWGATDEPPQYIVEEYKKIIEEYDLREIDIAFLRFTPFYGKENLDEIISDYRAGLENLGRTFKSTTFLLATFPLRNVQTTWKTWIKEVIGKEEIWEYGSNMWINEFNDHLRAVYQEEKAFFDLAKIQSTYPNGKRAVFTHNGNTYYHMARDYTYDGTHLNELGRQRVAEQLLMVMGSL